MTSPVTKIFRDFWQERGRTGLVILAIALGIAAFASVMSSYAILTRELDRGYLATNPASAVFFLDSIDDELIQTVLSDRSVSNAEPRRVVSGQIKSGPIQWRNLVLFVVKDYGNVQVARLEHERGAWPPATGEILIERDAFQVAQASIGDLVTVKTSNGNEQRLVISGSVHDVGQAQARMENVVYGYITLETLAQLGEQPYLDQLNILVAENRFDENHIREVAARIQTLIQARGHEIRHVDIPKPGKHPHSEIMGVLLLDVHLWAVCVSAQRDSRSELVNCDHVIASSTDWNHEGSRRFTPATPGNLPRPGNAARCRSYNHCAAGRPAWQPAPLSVHGGISEFRYQKFCSAALGLCPCSVSWNHHASSGGNVSGLARYQSTSPSCNLGLQPLAQQFWFCCNRSTTCKVGWKLSSIPYFFAE